MARINEYKSNGGVFENASDAISALDNLLVEIDKTQDQSISKLERDRRFRSNIAGIKDCFTTVLNASLDKWKDAGLDLSFVQEVEELNKEGFVKQLMFRHPIYEHVWLTDASGNDINSELLPFFVVKLDYSRTTESVKLSVDQLKIKLNLPSVRTAVNYAREDVEVMKKETELVNVIIESAKETEGDLTPSLEKYCKDNSLKIETSRKTTISPPSIEMSSNAPAAASAADEVIEDVTDAEIVDEENVDVGDADIVEDIDIGDDDDFNLPDIDAAFFGDEEESSSSSKKKKGRSKRSSAK